MAASVDGNVDGNVNGNSVLVVLSLFKRPENLPAQIEAIEQQTIHPCKLVVVDNRDYQGRVNSSVGIPDSFGRWQFPDPGGPTARWAPALLEIDCKYTLFIDDDILPGRRAIEHCLETAEKLEDQFSTLGSVGRMLNGPDGSEYVKRNIRAYRTPRPVDMTCRSHFCLTETVRQAQIYRCHLMRERPDEISRKAAIVHDDLFLSLCRQPIRWPCYLLPQATPDHSLRFQDLPDGKCGVSRRPEHLAERSAIVQAAKARGWQSLV